jgi:hypothetical protein
MREIRTSGLMSGEGKRTAVRHRASPRLYRASPSCICVKILAMRCYRQAIADVLTRRRRSRCKSTASDAIKAGASHSLQPVKITVQKQTEIGDHAAEGTRR